MSTSGSIFNPINFSFSTMSVEVNDGSEILLAIEKAEDPFRITELAKKSQHFKAELFEKIIRTALLKKSVDTTALFDILVTSKLPDKSIQELAREFYNLSPSLLMDFEF